jgi:cytochrome P450
VIEMSTAYGYTPAGSMERIVEIVILVAVALPLLRAAASAAYWRVYPRETFRMTVLGACYLIAIAVMAVYAPWALRAASAGAAVVGVYLLWRVRPRYGVSSGLPPGSLWPLPVRPWSDSNFYLRQAERYGRAFKTCRFGRPMIGIFGLERANRLLREHDMDLAPTPLPFNRFIEGGYLRYLPEELHAGYRKRFHAVFHSSALANAEPGMAAAFRRGFEGMADTCAAVGSTDLRVPVFRMNFEAWMSLFYGIPKGHADYARLRELFHVIDIRKARWSRRSRVEAALTEIEAILRRRVEAMDENERSKPNCFLAALAQGDSEVLNDRTVLGNMIYITHATWSDVSGLLLWIFKMLGDHPEWRDRLAAEPTRELAGRIVQETLRMEQSESRYRRALIDLNFDGIRIPKGWLVRMCIRESHRRDGVFADPDRFDPDRFTGRTYTRDEYAPFGVQRLACIGDNVARTAGEIFALELAKFRWQVIGDGPAEISTWDHSAPNPRLRVKLEPVRQEQ